MQTKKIHFCLEVEDGFPPIAVETLNARQCADGSFELLNTPFFAKESAYGDIVKARSSQGRLEHLTCLQESTYKAISVILLDPSVRARLIEDLKDDRCIVEYGEFPGFQMLAIAIPNTADYVRIRALLDAYEKTGELSFAELVV